MSNIISSDQVTINVNDQSAHTEVVHEIVRRLVQGMQPKQIFLFGSLAYGQPAEGSDIDLMVIVSKSDCPPHRRAQAAYACVGAVGVAKDLVVLTEEEFERQARVATSLARLVKEQGKILYERREESSGS
jgi:predicted nucleotidyltransferase